MRYPGSSSRSWTVSEMRDSIHPVLGLAEDSTAEVTGISEGFESRGGCLPTVALDVPDFPMYPLGCRSDLSRLSRQRLSALLLHGEGCLHPVRKSPHEGKTRLHRSAPPLFPCLHSKFSFVLKYRSYFECKVGRIFVQRYGFA